ncbi:MAG: acyl-CoA dehydrogenase family protein [Gammaproteobacteria bacterium]|nr:acyl-CoA dehydrogenase family protein [Gammaproteobacteria bacterium]
MIPQQYHEALAFEQALGDPANPDNTLSFRQAMALDEADAFPDVAVSFLNALGVPRVYVPEQLGGSFKSSETFVAMGRTLARRNMSVAVSFSTMLWSALAWIGGDAKQQRRIADWVLHDGHFPCLAYSEADHGADLAANELTARRNADGSYTLNGEKWPINRATRSGFLVLLARTDAGQHLRNHTLFIIDKNKLESRHYYHLPRVKTHGLRGCDISGIGFRECNIPADSRIGAEGFGLELALKGFQVTRTYCTALSLGVGDSALRLVADFAAQRQLYGAAMNTLPHTQHVLANAYLSQLMGECTAIVAARGLHLYPEQFSAWSTVAKVQVTHLVDFACQQLASVLGARYYLRERHGEGIFQKFIRDGAIVSIFDGSSLVCLDSLATLLPTLVRGHRDHVSPVDWPALYDLNCPLPSLPYERLDLFNRGRNAVMDSLPALLMQLDAVVADDELNVQTLSELRRLAVQLKNDLASLNANVLDEPVRRGERNSARQFAFAQHYCELHAAIAALGVWLYNRHALGSFFARGLWLQAALARAGRAEFRCGELAPALIGALHEQCEYQRTHAQMFSLLPWPLAARGLVETLPDFSKETYRDLQTA